MDKLSHPRARLEVRDASDVVELEVGLRGDLDLAGVSDILPAAEKLLTRRPQPLLVDLAGVQFCDSSGIALLIRLTKHFGDVHMHAATPPVRRVIQTLGMADFLGLEGT